MKRELKDKGQTILSRTVKPSMVDYAKPETPSIGLGDIMDNLHGQVFITLADGGGGWVNVVRIVHTPDGPISFVVLDNGTVINWRQIISIRPANSLEVGRG